MKILLITLLFMVVFFLIRGAVSFLFKPSNEPNQVVKSLSWRIGISIICFIIILGAQAGGWLKPSASLQYLYQPVK
ncbi:DUF2909 family protein [Gammaproteobacteria bacterium]|nr:DUF2909 family protein [Gammaproteobacteria bacterium]